MYNLLGNEMMSMGGVYVKFLQGVLLQSQFMKEWHNPDRLKIFEQLDHEPLDIVATLQREIPAKYLADLIEVQPQPFAAGSFGQVYYGTHKDGTKVIVKVLRPMIRETLKFDLKLLSTFSKSIQKKLFENAQMDLTDAFKDFTDATLKETDYIAEADFAIEQYHTYKDHPKLVVPRTYKQLCSPNVIVQEYIGGVSAAYLVGLVQQGVDPKKWVKKELGSDLDKQLHTLAYELLLGTFTLPRVMGDPHPGNVKLLSDDQIGMIDFGISARPANNKAAYFGLIKQYDALNKGTLNMKNLFVSTMRFFGGDLYRALHKVSSLASKDVDLNRELGKVVEKNFKLMTGGQDLKEIIKSPKAVTLINRIANKNNRFGFIMRLESTEMIRAAQSITTLLDSLGRYQTVIPGVYAKLIKTIERDYPEITTTQDAAMPTGQAIDILSSWMERVADRDPVLFQSLMSKLHLRKEQEAKAEATSV